MIEELNQSLFRQTLTECNSMARHALSTGLKIPPQLMSDLNTITAHLAETVKEESDVSAVRQDMLKRLTAIHSELVEIIAPAKPRAVMLLQEQAAKNKWWVKLGPVPLVRQMILIAMISMIGLILLSASEHINDTTSTRSIFELDGKVLLINLAFTILSAAVGASFSALFKVNHYIANSNYDPKYDTTYYTQFVLGLMAGLIISNLIPVSMNMEELQKSGLAALAQGGFMHMAFAILGGFSSSAVHRMMNRLVFTIEALIQGENKNDLDEHKKIFRMKQEAEQLKEKVELANQLSALLHQLDNEGNHNARKEVSDLVDRLIGEHSFYIEEPSAKTGTEQLPKQQKQLPDQAD